MSDDQETRKLENQIVESFTVCKYFTLSRTRTGGTLIFMNGVTYASLPPIHAAALKTLEHTIVSHHLMGVDVNAEAYVNGVETVLHSLRQGAAETWGYEHE